MLSEEKEVKPHTRRHTIIRNVRIYDDSGLMDKSGVVFFDENGDIECMSTKKFNQEKVNRKEMQDAVTFEGKGLSFMRGGMMDTHHHGQGLGKEAYGWEDVTKANHVKNAALALGATGLSYVMATLPSLNPGWCEFRVLDELPPYKKNAKDPKDSLYKLLPGSAKATYAIIKGNLYYIDKIAETHTLLPLMPDLDTLLKALSESGINIDLSKPETLQTKPSDNYPSYPMLKDDDPSARLSSDALAAITKNTGHTHPKGSLIAALEDLNQYIAAEKKNPTPGATKIVGIHLEGPFIAQNCKGAHDEKVLQDHITYDLLREIIKAAPEVTQWKMTLAPDLPGAIEFLDDLKKHQQELDKQGISISVFVGHNNANKDLLAQAFKKGARGFTHTGNACGETKAREKNVAKHNAASNLTQFILENPQAVPKGGVEIIVDNRHLSKEYVQLLYNTIGPELLLITDALGPAGCDDGAYKLGSLDIVKKGPAFYLASDPQKLAGSAASLSYCCESYVQMVAADKSNEKKMDALWQSTSPFANPGISSVDQKTRDEIAKNNNNGVLMDADGKMVMSVVNGKVMEFKPKELRRRRKISKELKVKIQNEVNDVMSQYKQVDDINVRIKKLKILKKLFAGDPNNPDLGSYAQLVKIYKDKYGKEQIESIKAKYPKQSDQLLAEKNLLINMAKFASDKNYSNASIFAGLIDDAYNRLAKQEAQQVTAANIEIAQEALKDLSQNAASRDALNLALPIDFCEKIYVEKNQDTVRKDAKTLINALAPQTIIQKNSSGQISERSIAKDPMKEMSEKNIWPDAILIMGNNDLKQVDNVANIYKNLVEQGHPPKRIYISGYGGHGTSLGYIFGSTEAEAMQRRLVDLGVPLDIIRVETEAIDSGKNVQYTSKMMLDEMKADKTGKLKFNNILISGTPAGLLRQGRSFEKQAKDFPWMTIITLPPSATEIDELYHATELGTMINMMCLMREAASFLIYSVTSQYMSPREVPNDKTLTEAIYVFVDYYNLLTNNVIHKEKFANDFIEYSKKLAACTNSQEIEKLQASYKDTSLVKDIKEMSNYLRTSFEAIERETMKYIPNVVEKKAPASFDRKKQMDIQATFLNTQEGKAFIKSEKNSLQLRALLDPYNLIPINTMAASATKAGLFQQNETPDFPRRAQNVGKQEVSPLPEKKK